MINNKEALKVAKEKGYYCDKLGNIYSPNKKLKLIKTRNYYQFSVRVNGIGTPILVHRFIGYLKYDEKIFDENFLIRHLDGNSLNNFWENILIGTQSENMKDIPELNRIKKSITASIGLRRFTDEEVINIIEDRRKGLTYKELSEKYNTSKSTLSYFFNNAYYSGAKNINEIKVI